VRGAVILSLVLLLAACLPSPPRAPRLLTTVGSVAVSNSPTLVERHEPVVEGGRVTVDYALLWGARGPAPRVSAAHTPTAALGDQAVETVCRLRGIVVPAPLVLTAGSRARLDCRMTAPGGAAFLQAHGDQTLSLNLPVRLLQDEKDGTGTLTFGYPLRREDAQ
jgi:hypothetical protein